MAAREYQTQEIVFKSAIMLQHIEGIALVDEPQRCLISMSALIVPIQIDGSIAPSRDQPRSGIIRNSADWPALECLDDGLLSHILRTVEISEHANEGGSYFRTHGPKYGTQIVALSRELRHIHCDRRPGESPASRWQRWEAWPRIRLPAPVCLR